MFNAINPNVRSAVAFSAKRDVMRNGQQPANSTPSSTHTQPRFGALPLYQGPYNNIHVITDFQDQASNARIQQRFQEVQKFVAQHRPADNLFKRLAHAFTQNKNAAKQTKTLGGFGWDQATRWKKDSHKGILNQNSISDIPLRNIDAASQTLFELAHEPNQDLFVHVTDPGVGSGQETHKRSILVSERHGIHVGPNNGSLGLLAKFLQQKKDPFKVMEIDLDKISQLESLRTGVPKADNGSTFHGRDVFGVAAAAIAGGLAPEALSKKGTIQPVYAAFAQGAKLPTKKGETVAVHANRDNTSGNLVLNLATTPGADTLTLSKPAPKPEPRFAGWGTFMKILPFVEVGLKYGSDRLDRSMQRDEQRRKARERYEKIGSSYREYDRRGQHYRTVTRIKVVDGNGKVLERHERVGRWHRAR